MGHKHFKTKRLRSVAPSFYFLPTLSDSHPVPHTLPPYIVPKIYVLPIGTGLQLRLIRKKQLKQMQFLKENVHD